MQHEIRSWLFPTHSQCGLEVVRSDDRSYRPIKMALRGNQQHLEWTSFCLRFLAVSLARWTLLCEHVNPSKFDKDLDMGLFKKAISDVHRQCPRLPYKCLGIASYIPLVLFWSDVSKFIPSGQHASLRVEALCYMGLPQDNLNGL